MALDFFAGCIGGISIINIDFFLQCFLVIVTTRLALIAY